MPVAEEAKCRCDMPEPYGPYMYGIFILCARCKRVANWRDLEDDTNVKQEG